MGYDALSKIQIFCFGFSFFVRGGRCQNHFLILAELVYVQVTNQDDMLILFHWYANWALTYKMLDNAKCSYCL